MAIGLITSPVTWLNGTVASPTWFQAAQDNINGWMNGTGYTMKSLQFDGSGASPTTFGADTPILSSKNSAGNSRAVLVDHNGLFTMGRVSHRREEWWTSFSIAGASTAVVSANQTWFVTQVGAAAQTQTAIETTGSNIVVLQPSNVLNNKSAIATNQTVMYPGSTVTSVFECEAAFDQVGANSLTGWIGFCGAKDPTAPAGGFAWFKRASTDTNWRCQTNDGATTNDLDSGVAPTTAYQRFRIEVHGSATPYGAATVRFFINEALVQTSTSNLPTAGLFMVMGCLATAAGTGHSMAVSPVSLSNNRTAAVAGIL